jgi:hypothetical protein
MIWGVSLVKFSDKVTRSRSQLFYMDYPGCHEILTHSPFINSALPMALTTIPFLFAVTITASKSKEVPN